MACFFLVVFLFFFPSPPQFLSFPPILSLRLIQLKQRQQFQQQILLQQYQIQQQQLAEQHQKQMQVTCSKVLYNFLSIL